ncbi:MAG: hypothetical protein ABFS45_20000 [Pseudomonadota bacterium]
MSSLSEGGAFVRTQIGAWSFDKLESMVLQQIPGYEINVDPFC